MQRKPLLQTYNNKLILEKCMLAFANVVILTLRFANYQTRRSF